MSGKHARRWGALVLLAVLAPAARAADRYWISGSDFWDIGADWSATSGGPGGAGMPNNGDNAFVLSSNQFTITRDGFTPSYTPPGIALARLGGSGGAVITLQQIGSAGTFAASTFDIGYNGTAQYQEFAGSGVFGQVNVGAFGAGVGTYLIDGTLTTMTTNVLNVGNSNSNIGTFNQNNGQVTVNSTLTLGFNTATAHGFYNLVGGTLLGGQLSIADVGTSVFNQTGGTGQFQTVLIGGAGAGTFNISGGAMFSGANPTFVGNSSFAAGSLNISGTGLYNAAGGMTINPTGRVTVNGGTLTFLSNLSINGGRLDFNGGTFMPASGASISISGGGTANLNAFYSLPSNTGFSITSGQLTIPNITFIGSNGIGTLSATGSNSRVVAGPSATIIGTGTGGSATATFSTSATGTFNQVNLGTSSGAGTLNVQNASVTTGTLLAGYQGGAATINVSSNASLIIAGAANFSIGDFNGAGTINVTSGGYLQGGTGTQTIGRGGRLTLNGGAYRGFGPLLIDGGTLSDLTSGYLGSPAMTVRNGGLASLAGSFVPADPLTSVQSDGIYDVGAGTGQISLGPGALFTLAGGRVNAGTVTSNGGDLQFTSGTLDIRGSAGVMIQPGGLLDNNLDLTSGKTLLVTNTTALAAGSSLALDGGLLVTSALAGTGSFVLNTGTLRLTNSDFVAGPGIVFGNSFRINSGARVDITGPSKQANVNAGALLYLGGGSLSAAGGLTNNGEVQLDGGVSRISGGPFFNGGLLRGTGRVDNVLNNLTTGTIRANPGDDLTFTSGGAQNDGTIQLLGGVVEFKQSLFSSGFIGGDGSLFATGGLSNAGSLTLSGGTGRIYGNVTNTATARVLVTGGSTSTFYNNVTNQAGSQFKVSSASVAAFLGTVSGLSGFSGSGTTIFEGPASLGALAAGTSVVELTGSLQADLIRQPGLILHAGGNASIVANGSTAATSRLNSLAIEGATDAWQAKLDLADNALVIDYSAASPLPEVQNQIRSGYAGGSWAGNGITSSRAALAASSPHKTALGYAEASALGVTSFRGQSVDNTAVLIRYVYAGDANLDGVVDTLDFNSLAANFGGTSKLWNQADFNYDGVVDTLDFNNLAANFGQSLPAAGDGPTTSSLAAALVPEPGGLMLAGASLVTTTGVRRRRRIRLQKPVAPRRCH
jgi:hypothetical protein